MCEIGLHVHFRLNFAQNSLKGILYISLESVGLAPAAPLKKIWILHLDKLDFVVILASRFKRLSANSLSGLDGCCVLVLGSGALF